ncbi:hypothetical protein [uncultured Thiohalocapsa sp.]|uniref:hypothetical protein n=1 Tax=uncultured Thiohalocapsa sp. TaxID=768990 RepID=UPI0025D5C5F7|nr:hypothetical protein [uncultured Thiohalocapsa sp.]
MSRFDDDPRNHGNADVQLPQRTDRQDHLLEREPEPARPYLRDNHTLVDQALDRAHGNLVARLFPGEVERAVRGAELQQLEIGFDYRRRALEMAVETKLQAIEEICNHALVTGKGEIRRKRQEFFAEQKLLLQVAMDDCAERFHAQLERRFDAMTRLKVPRIREREEQRLEEAVDRFHDMLADLTDDFIDIIRERVHRDGG